MITREEVLKGEILPAEFYQNLIILLEKVNALRELWGKPMVITSGFRSWEHHCRVYRDKGILTQKEYELYVKTGKKIENSKIPTKSRHLSCEAVDISDPNFELTDFCKNNKKEMEEIGIYFENDRSVPRLHVQIRPPASGKRWFDIR